MDNKIGAYLAKPNESLTDVRLDLNDPKDIGAFIPGEVDTVRPYNDDFVVIYSKNGKELGLKPCRAITFKNETDMHVFYGPILIALIDEKGSYVSVGSSYRILKHRAPFSWAHHITFDDLGNAHCIYYDPDEFPNGYVEEPWPDSDFVDDKQYIIAD